MTCSDFMLFLDYIQIKPEQQAKHDEDFKPDNIIHTSKYLREHGIIRIEIEQD